MVEIVGVRFRSAGKVYFFDPGDAGELHQGSHVIVETARGTEMGHVVLGRKMIRDEEAVLPLKRVIRVANDQDVARWQQNAAREEEAYSVCNAKIKEHKLDMKLVDVEVTFDNSKILFYFTADGRIDFRELVKDLAAAFRTRIELRQIGVRDESKMMGGLGICGRELCCSSYLSDFHPVSIRMAKEQGLSLNPTKISGTCGRLMCCLKYEQGVYEDAMKRLPKPGALVQTPAGTGSVTEVNFLKEMVKVKFENGNEVEIKTFRPEEIKVIREGRARHPREDADSSLAELKALED